MTPLCSAMIFLSNFNRLTAIRFWREPENSLSFFIRRNQYEKICRWLFALVLFFRVASTVLFLLTKPVSNRDTKKTPYSRHRKHKLRKNKSGRACSQRAQLLGVTLGRLRGQKLAEILIFYVGPKKSGRRYATTAVKLLRWRQHHTSNQGEKISMQTC